MQALIGLKKHISIMHGLYTNEISDCIKPAGISLTFIHWHAKNNENPCICSIALVSRRLSIIFVELSGHELCTEWRRPKLKNKIKDISRRWKGHTNKWNALQCYLQNNTHTLWKNSCSFPRDLAHRTQSSHQPSFLQICFHHYPRSNVIYKFHIQKLP